MKTVEYKAGDRVFFFVGTQLLERQIQVKKEILSEWDHKTVYTTYDMLSDQNCLNPTRYVREPNEVFRTKEQALLSRIGKYNIP